MFRNFGLRGFLVNALNELRTDLASISTMVQGSTANTSQMFSTTIQILKEFHNMTAALDRLTAKVAEVSTQAASLETLVKGLADQIRAGIGDDDALNALADSLDATSKGIADAVTANTPAAPAPDPTPTPAPDVPPAA